VLKKARREELKQFLRSRRARLSPADFGFPEGPRRRTPGLRRDEVALLANIGTTTYTFLEQGRDINVSPQVVYRLAEVLRLSPQEKRHLYELAIGNAPRPAPGSTDISDSLKIMLDYLLPCPANVLNYRFDLVAHNRASQIVFKYPSDAVEQRFNILEQLVMDEERQKLFVDVDLYMRNLMAYFRLTYAHYSDDESLVKLVEKLESKSESFRRWWSEYYVLSTEDLMEPVRLNHAEMGELFGRFNVFNIFGHGDLTLSVLTPEPGTNTADKIRKALSETASAKK
jgi:MmyB-like transcription regulator ligand binding domain/Helix-turn-helix domain